jgi:hypothetical protein
MLGVLRVDEDVACLLSYIEQGNTLSSSNTRFPARSSVADSPKIEEFEVSSPDEADILAFLGCDAFLIEPSAAPATSNVRESSASSGDLPADHDVVEVTVAYAGLPSGLVWDTAIDRGARCEFAWPGCTAYPDASIEGWLDGRALIQAAEIWRNIGRIAWQVADLVGQGRDSLIAATSRQIAGWLQWPAAAARQASHEPTPGEAPSSQWPRTSRTPGLLLAL